MIWRKHWALRLGVGASAPMKRVDMGTRGPESRGCVHGNPIHGMMTTGRYGSATLRSSARLCRGNLFRACGGWRAIREERDGNVYLSMQGPSPALPDVTGHHPGRASGRHSHIADRPWPPRSGLGCRPTRHRRRFARSGADRLPNRRNIWRRDRIFRMRSNICGTAFSDPAASRDGILGNQPFDHALPAALIRRT
jgi:hypothetical protein